MGVAILVLPVGICSPTRRPIAFVWFFLSYVLQTLGELLISPIGYAMIGKLAPSKYRA